ncbi:MAG TPA: sulfatase-like hydrolase/transferase [Planctomycetota bacterium]
MRASVLALILCQASCGRTEEADGRPGSSPARSPILFISFDTLGAEHTSLHGYSRDTTPIMAGLGEESVVFERCLANAPYTRASYVSQFSGLLPSCSSVDREAFREKHGRAPRTWEVFRITEGRRTLTETLRAGGYRTAAFIDNHNAGEAFGIGQGFEHFDTGAADVAMPDSESGIRRIVPAVLAWIDSLPRGTPFFVFVNAADTHKPYLPGPDFLDRYKGDTDGEPDAEYPVGIGGFGVVDMEHVEDYFQEPPFPTRMRTAPIVARYDEEVLRLDQDFGRLIAGLRERELLDDMLLVISADHGEAMGQPDFKFGHGTHVEQVLHVPLLMRFPGRRYGGLRIAAPVQLLDLYPTLADWAGLEAPDYLQGQSLLPLLDGGSLGERSFVHETGRLTTTSVSEGHWRLAVSYPGASNHCVLSARGRAWLAENHPELGGDYFVVTGLNRRLASDPRARAILLEARAALKGPFFELFDTRDDPHLLRDLAQEKPEIVARLRQRLQASQELSRTERTRMPVQAVAFEHPMDLEELRRLGYVGDDGEVDD